MATSTTTPMNEPLNDNNNNLIINQPTTSNTFSSFLPPFQYSNSSSLGHRLLKSSTNLLLPPPFSKLFFTGNTKQQKKSMLSTNTTIKKQQDPFPVIHDEELCMFYIKLDSKGTTAAICYLPTTIKNVIEAYHIEIPIAYRHKGLGDKLVKECLNWAKESGTLVIPTCAFVKRHLECIGFQKSVILEEFPPP